MSIKTFKIQIKGRVQGVGFRPFVFNLANQYQLKGTVSNNENGVIIYCNASKEKAEMFLAGILQNKPEIAIITAHTIVESSFSDYTNFAIIPSEVSSQINIPLTPDFAVCESCKAEISDSKNRRLNYAFTTCVHCGPRYAITTKFPFERAHTSLTNFKMCADCGEEYTNPNDRRFHSQTNSCATCGIQLWITNDLGRVIKEEPIIKVSQFISEGKIIAIKNTNGYILCCDASNPEAIKTLRTRKKRPSKPFAVVYPSIKLIKKEFEVSSYEETALQSTIAPIVILQNTKDTSISVNVIAPNLSQTGVMLPSSSLLELILKIVNKPMVCTSGNSHGLPIISIVKEATKQLNEIADCFLHHNLDIQFPQDDSVVKFANEQQLILRRSRGLAPNYMDATINSKEPILAMGAHLKSTFAFVPNAQIYVSQYFGNLDSYDVLERYKATILNYISLFETKPKTILIDTHSQYQSSVLGNEFASEWDTSVQKIQHHKAHFASVLGEHQLFDSEEKILGVVWDGTGLGDHDTIWGGEFFSYQNKEIERISHFEYYDWLANDKMAKEPRLALLSLLDAENRHYIKNKFSETEWKIYTKMLENNVLKTSSVGRLFDAVASVLNIKDSNTFEAEAAMLLEDCAATYSKSDYIDFLDNVTYDTIPSKLIIKAIVEAYKNGICKERLAYSFIYTLAKSIIAIAQRQHINTVACSGGVFQNSVLIKTLSRLCINSKIKLKLNCNLSCNDENIAFGQLVYFQNIKN